MLPPTWSLYFIKSLTIEINHWQSFKSDYTIIKYSPYSTVSVWKPDRDGLFPEDRISFDKLGLSAYSRLNIHTASFKTYYGLHNWVQWGQIEDEYLREVAEVVLWCSGYRVADALLGLTATGIKSPGNPFHLVKVGSISVLLGPI